ncbi:unnamed protein product [Amoebophrya sp. A25]|nr:unnamed protein product [Amoebophrya sp. A25]|eukprot:GSA25T00019605001.1
MTLCTGSTIAAYTYIHLMKTGGAEFVLEQTGLVGSSSLETAAKYGERYGMLGLFAIQVSPVPVPTAILVVTGMLSGVEEWEIYAIVSFAKYLQLVFGALVLQYTVLYDSETGEKKKIEAVIDEYVFGGGKKKEEEKTSSSTTEMTAKKQKKRA